MRRGHGVIYPMQLSCIMYCFLLPKSSNCQHLDPSAWPSEEETCLVIDMYPRFHSQGWSEGEVLSSVLRSECVLNYQE